MNVKITDKQKIRVNDPHSLYEVMREILLHENQIERESEHVWTVALRADNKILNIELSSLGSVDAAMVKPMQVFRFALIKGATKLIIVHNHPTDLLVPSEADLDITNRMIQVGNIINLTVEDHLIISEEGFFSFQEKGLMDELRRSNKYAPAYIEMERIKKEAIRIGKKEGEKKGLKKGKEIGLERGIKKGKNEGEKIGAEKEKQEMARKLKKKGIPLDVIAETTGLSLKEIEEL